MRFRDPRLQDALAQWRDLKEVEQRAAADNIWFEERVSAERQAAFEQEAHTATDLASLRKAQIDYAKTYVFIGNGIAHTFVAELKPFDLSYIDETQLIVRLEDLSKPLSGLRDIEFGDLQAAFEENQPEVIDKFLADWNVNRDFRPAFATFRDGVGDDLGRSDWAERLRDRLGLAHYDCRVGPIPVALMQYTVAEVKEAAAKAAASCAVTFPTAFDTGPWPHFYPAPPELNCGRTMALFEVEDDKELLAEILHFRIEYERHHLVMLGEIRNPPKPCDLRRLRNHHLLALRIAAGRDDFGEEIPE